jgi:uncharacterized lipoprotein YddW (UPF0748 family)
MFFLRTTIQSLGILIISVFTAGCVHTYVPHRDVMPTREARVPILLYHHIAQLPDNASPAQKRWTLTPEQFDDQIRWIVKHGFHPVTMAELSGHLKDGLPLPLKPIVISFDDGWKDQYNNAFPILKKYNFKATFFIITDSVGHSAYMNWDEVLKISDSAMDIELHSHTHARLPALSVKEAWQEIDDSKKILENHLKKPVSVFAYPYGHYDDEIISLVKDAGFDAAVTLSGLNNGYLFRADQSYTMSRYAVEGSDKLEYVSQLKDVPTSICPALFVSLVQYPSIFSNKEGIDALIEFAAQANINTLFIQVYRENKAWFPSQIADDSPYEKSRLDLAEDALARIIRLAHSKGIQVHAWLNLLSLSQNKNAEFLKKYGPDVLTRNLKHKKRFSDYLIDAQYFLEPGDLRVRRDLSKIVSELLSAYPELDGIQFDYIRYPDLEPHYGYAKSNVERFKKTTGLSVIDEQSLVWKQWKRAQVTELLTILVKTARSLRPNIQVSATGCMPLIRATHEAYQDWPSWINHGLIDFVTLMDYSPDPQEFRRWLVVAQEKVSDLSRVRVGIGAYKLVNASESFDSEFHTLKELGMKGAIFHYGSLLESQQLKSIVIKKNSPEDR